MKKQLLIVASAVLLSIGAAQAQVVVRIGPPPPRPVEVVRGSSARASRTGPGMPAITAGTEHGTYGSPEPTCSLHILMHAGLKVVGITVAMVTGGMKVTGGRIGLRFN